MAPSLIKTLRVGKAAAEAAYLFSFFQEKLAAHFLRDGRTSMYQTSLVSQYQTEDIERELLTLLRAEGWVVELLPNKQYNISLE